MGIATFSFAIIKKNDSPYFKLFAGLKRASRASGVLIDRRLLRVWWSEQTEQAFLTSEEPSRV